MLQDCGHRRGDLARQYRLCRGARMYAVGLHQGRVAGGYALEKTGQVMDPGFAAHGFEDLLKTGVVGRAEIGRHAHSDEQNGHRLLFSQLHHLAQVIGALGKTKPAQAIVAAEFDDQVGGIVLIQQTGQPLQSTESRFAANAGIDHACLRKTRPYIGAEQLRPALVYRNIVGGGKAVTQNQDPGRRVVCVTCPGSAQTQEQDHD